MQLSARRAVAKAILAGIVVVVIVVAAAGVLLLNPGIFSSSNTTTTSSTAHNKSFRILMFTTTPSTTPWGAEITRGLNQAVLALNNTNGFVLKVTTAYDIAYGDAQSFMASYASQGFDMIIAQDAGYGSAVTAVASQFPNVQFFIATGPGSIARNVASWSGDHWKGEFMAGVVAGLMTKTNIIGVVTSFQYDQPVEAINAFLAGAKLTNTNVKIVYVFAGSWSDSVKGASGAEALAAQGADVIAGFGDGLADGAVAGAQTAGVYAIGYLHDANSLAPSTVLTSILLNSTEYYIKGIQAAEAGQIGFKNFVLDIYPDRVTGLTPFHGLVPASALSIANPILQKITSGQLVPPTNTTLPSQMQT